MLNAFDLHTLVATYLPQTAFTGVAYHFAGGYTNIIQYTESATPEQVLLGNTITSGFESLGLSANKYEIMADNSDTTTIVAVAEVGDTEIRFDIWDSTGDHALNNSVVAVVDGGASYVLKTALAETYKVRAIGNVSLYSNYIEIKAV